MSVPWMTPASDVDELPARLRWEAAKALLSAPGTHAATDGVDEPPVNQWWMADNGLIDAHPERGVRAQVDEGGVRARTHPHATPVLHHH